MTQPDIEVALDFAIEQTGKPYTTRRPIEEYTWSYDCSALVIAGLIHMYHAVGMQPPPDLLRCSNTVDLYRWAQRIGGLVTVDKAVRTRGAILIKGKWYGYGRFGHTAYSEGNGREMAAHSARSGIHESDVYGGRNYQDGFIIPENYNGGVFYKDLQPPVDPAVLAELVKLEQWGKRVTAKPLRMNDPDSGNIGILNTLLASRGLRPTQGLMNRYTSVTRDAVVHFKKLAHLSNIVGDTFGGEAVDAILKGAA